MNYMIYPLKNMRITCNYKEGSHKNHWENTDNKDYPIDDAGIDTGRDNIYCPCDEMKVTAIHGVDDTLTTNTIWLVSTSKVITPTFIDYAFITLTHSNDSDLSNIKVGDIFKRGDIICREGRDGYTTGNHIHICCGKGYSDNWIVNSNGSLVIDGDCMKPEDVFFIDKSFTTIINSGSINWIDLSHQVIDIIGTPVSRNECREQVEVLINNLNIRESYSTNSLRLGYIRKGIYNVLDKKENEGFLWMKVENYWIATRDGWTKYYPKELDNLELLFECEKTGKYIVNLEKGNKLYISK